MYGCSFCLWFEFLYENSHSAAKSLLLEVWHVDLANLGGVQSASFIDAIISAFDAHGCLVVFRGRQVSEQLKFNRSYLGTVVFHFEILDLVYFIIEKSSERDFDFCYRSAAHWIVYEQWRSIFISLIIFLLHFIHNTLSFNTIWVLMKRRLNCIITRKLRQRVLPTTNLFANIYIILDIVI